MNNKRKRHHKRAYSSTYAKSEKTIRTRGVSLCSDVIVPFYVMMKNKAETIPMPAASTVW